MGARDVFPRTQAPCGDHRNAQSRERAECASRVCGADPGRELSRAAACAKRGSKRRAIDAIQRTQGGKNAGEHQRGRAACGRPTGGETTSQNDRALAGASRPRGAHSTAKIKMLPTRLTPTTLRLASCQIMLQARHNRGWRSSSLRHARTRNREVSKLARHSAVIQPIRGLLIF